ncbi:site-specific DNA-methyltransferase [Brevibacterium sp. JNUCC-42]|nr:site-specific DNA-methyltransferase [Brevibacterium sp. JNUCC-42]
MNKSDLVENIDCRELVKKLDMGSIDLLVTSPPYWAKRVYNEGEERELGAEETPEEFVKSLADYFEIFKPYIKSEGNLFINIGDTYFGSGAGAWSKYLDQEGNITQTQKDRKEKYFTTKPLQPKIRQDGKLYQNKQLLLIPSRFAIEMQSRGWILRDDIIWRKPNRIPASVKDRFNNTYEHVFHFVQSKKYFFDLDAVKVLGSNGNMKNPGDVWDINTQPLSGSHTATFPEALVEICVKCASPENGLVFDPFMGTGTSWIVSKKLNRCFVGAEINKEFYDFAHDRFNSSLTKPHQFHF